jgi:hypothetical protein
MARAGMIAVAVRDERAGDRLGRIDVEIPRRAIKPFRGGAEKGFGAHRGKLGIGGGSVITWARREASPRWSD